jgi:hypothetical protein
MASFTCPQDLHVPYPVTYLSVSNCSAPNARVFDPIQLHTVNALSKVPMQLLVCPSWPRITPAVGGGS